MNVLSLFDGMSCGRIALERANIKVDNYYASEIDKYAMQVSKKNYPSIHHVGSVIDIDTSEFKDIDLLIGGSPCQGFSISGRMQGSATKCGIDVTSLEQYIQLKDMGFKFDGQSYLFWEYIRVLRDIKPKYFLLENVRVTKKWLPMFNEALGVEPIMINSRLLSAQNRVRYYWTNIPDVAQPQDKGISIKDILANSDEYNWPSEILIVKEPTKKGFIEVANGQCFDNSFPNSPTRRGRSMVDKANCLQTSNQFMRYESPFCRRLTPIECERLQTVPDSYTDCVNNNQRYKMLGNGWTVDVIAHIFKGLK